MKRANVELLIPPRWASIGAARVLRSLPHREKRMIGPFIFLDRMGPERLEPGDPLGDVLPHPHIGLSTVTYLFEGELHHRDSVGSAQLIRAGDVNWMTAGSGIVHSERHPPLTTARGLHGLQIWVALPTALEDAPPGFEHAPASALPKAQDPGVSLKLIAGEALGMRSPVKGASPLFYVEVDLLPGRHLLRRPPGECGVYAAHGTPSVAGQVLEDGAIAVLSPSQDFEVDCERPTKLLLLGGEPLDGGGPRLIWWNFVASSRERIQQALEDWRDNRFPKIPGEGPARVPAPEGELPARLK